MNEAEYKAEIEDLNWVIWLLATARPRDDPKAKKIIALAKAQHELKTAQVALDPAMAGFTPDYSKPSEPHADQKAPTYPSLEDWTKRFSVRSRNVILVKLGPDQTIIDLAMKSEVEMYRCKSFGRISLLQVKRALAIHDLYFGMSRIDAEKAFKPK